MLKNMNFTTSSIRKIDKSEVYQFTSRGTLDGFEKIQQISKAMDTSCTLDNKIKKSIYFLTSKLASLPLQYLVGIYICFPPLFFLPI